MPYDVDDQYALQGCSFVYVITNFFQNLYGVLFVFPGRKKIFRREIFDGSYGVGPAVFTQFIMDIPHYVFIPLIATLIVYFMAGYTYGFLVFLNMWCSLMGNIFCASALGYVISTAADSVASKSLYNQPLKYDGISRLYYIRNYCRISSILLLWTKTDYFSCKCHDFTDCLTTFAVFWTFYQSKSHSSLLFLDEVPELVLLRDGEYLHRPVDFLRYFCVCTRHGHTTSC